MIEFGSGCDVKTEVEIKEIDRKYERYRMRSSGREKLLLSSILASGIEEPLSGVLPPKGAPILLDGFKRLRCAEKLKLNHVPFLSLGEDEALAIFSLLKTSNAKGLTLLEQAKWVDELKRVHGLSVAEIARRLQRSQSWVCVRFNVLSEMSELVAEEIFSGRFPAYSLLYTLRHFRRLNGIPKSEIDDFVGAVSGKNCSVRDVEILANAFFRGGEEIRGQILKGDLSWCLGELKARERIQANHERALTETEVRVLRDLEIVQGCMGRLTLKLALIKEGEPSFIAQTELLAQGVLRRTEKFSEIVRGFCDRFRKA